MDYVLYFGRFSEEKGIGTLIKVCKELPDVQFIFAGTGPLEETVNGIKNIPASTAATNGSAAICCTSAARSSARCWAIPHRLQPGQSAPDAAAIDGR